MKWSSAGFFHLGLVEVSLGVRPMERECSIYSFWPHFQMYYNFRAFNLHKKPVLLYCLSGPRVDAI